MTDAGKATSHPIPPSAGIATSRSAHNAPPHSLPRPANRLTEEPRREAHAIRYTEGSVKGLIEGHARNIRGITLTLCGDVLPTICTSDADTVNVRQ